MPPVRAYIILGSASSGERRCPGGSKQLGTSLCRIYSGATSKILFAPALEICNSLRRWARTGKLCCNHAVRTIFAHHRSSTFAKAHARTFANACSRHLLPAAAACLPHAAAATAAAAACRCLLLLLLLLLLLAACFCCRLLLPAAACCCGPCVPVWQVPISKCDQPIGFVMRNADVSNSKAKAATRSLDAGKQLRLPVSGEW